MGRNTKILKDFSIIIPTFNRSKFLKLALKSVLRQRGVSFEIIVSDNCSTDDTEMVVKEFKDKRIKYMKNKKNLGYALNVQKCFLQASGDYIFTLADDDFILDENTLFEVLKIMRKYKVGVAKIGSISYEKSPKFPYQVHVLSDKLIILKPKKEKKIILKTIDFGLGFYSGLVFNSSLIDKRKLINQKSNIFKIYTYFPLAFDAISKYGIAFIPKLFIVAHLSTEHIGYYFDINKFGSFLMDDIFDFIKKFITGKDYEVYKGEFIKKNIMILPSMKYFSSYRNYIKILRRLMNIDKTLLTDYKFLIISLSGFLPNFMIKAIRDLMIYFSERDVREKVNKYNYFIKIAKIGTQ